MVKKLKVEVVLYKYNELNDKAKENAFNEHYNFLCSIEDDGQTEKDIYEGVEESIIINEYLFFQDGEMANITHYTNGHKKAGTTELNFNGKIYKI